MPFGFSALKNFANNAVNAAASVANEAAKAAEKAVDSAAKAAETATAGVAQATGAPAPTAPASSVQRPQAPKPTPSVQQQQPRVPQPQHPTPQNVRQPQPMGPRTPVQPAAGRPRTPGQATSLQQPTPVQKQPQNLTQNQFPQQQQQQTLDSLGNQQQFGLNEQQQHGGSMGTDVQQQQQHPQQQQSAFSGSAQQQQQPFPNGHGVQQMGAPPFSQEQTSQLGPQDQQQQQQTQQQSFIQTQNYGETSSQFRPQGPVGPMGTSGPPGIRMGGPPQQTSGPPQQMSGPPQTGPPQQMSGPAQTVPPPQISGPAQTGPPQQQGPGPPFLSSPGGRGPRGLRPRGPTVAGPRGPISPRGPRGLRGPRPPGARPSSLSPRGPRPWGDHVSGGPPSAMQPHHHMGNGQPFQENQTGFNASDINAAGTTGATNPHINHNSAKPTHPTHMASSMVSQPTSNSMLMPHHPGKRPGSRIRPLSHPVPSAPPSRTRPRPLFGHSKPFRPSLLMSPKQATKAAVAAAATPVADLSSQQTPPPPPPVIDANGAGQRSTAPLGGMMMMTSSGTQLPIEHPLIGPPDFDPLLFPDLQDLPDFNSEYFRRRHSSSEVDEGHKGRQEQQPLRHRLSLYDNDDDNNTEVSVRLIETLESEYAQKLKMLSMDEEDDEDHEEDEEQEQVQDGSKEREPEQSKMKFTQPSPTMDNEQFSKRLSLVDSELAKHGALSQHEGPESADGTSVALVEPRRVSSHFIPEFTNEPFPMSPPEAEVIHQQLMDLDRKVHSDQASGGVYPIPEEPFEETVGVTPTAPDGVSRRRNRPAATSTASSDRHKGDFGGPDDGGPLDPLLIGLDEPQPSPLSRKAKLRSPLFSQASFEFSDTDEVMKQPLTTKQKASRVDEFMKNLSPEKKKKMEKEEKELPKKKELPAADNNEEADVVQCRQGTGSPKSPKFAPGITGSDFAALGFSDFSPLRSRRDLFSPPYSDRDIGRYRRPQSDSPPFHLDSPKRTRSRSRSKSNAFHSISPPLSPPGDDYGYNQNGAQRRSRPSSRASRSSSRTRKKSVDLDRARRKDESDYHSRRRRSTSASRKKTARFADDPEASSPAYSDEFSADEGSSGERPRGRRRSSSSRRRRHEDQRRRSSSSAGRIRRRSGSRPRKEDEEKEEIEREERRRHSPKRAEYQKGYSQTGGYGQQQQPYQQGAVGGAGVYGNQLHPNQQPYQQQQQQQESISGMLNNFSKALDEALLRFMTDRSYSPTATSPARRPSPKSRRTCLGNTPRPSPTVDPNQAYYQQNRYSQPQQQQQRPQYMPQSQIQPQQMQQQQYRQQQPYQQKPMQPQGQYQQSQYGTQQRQMTGGGYGQPQQSMMSNMQGGQMPTMSQQPGMMQQQQQPMMQQRQMPMSQMQTPMVAQQPNFAQASQQSSYVMPSQQSAANLMPQSQSNLLPQHQPSVIGPQQSNIMQSVQQPQQPLQQQQQQQQPLLVGRQPTQFVSSYQQQQQPASMVVHQLPPTQQQYLQQPTFGLSSSNYQPSQPLSSGATLQVIGPQIQPTSNVAAVGPSPYTGQFLDQQQNLMQANQLPNNIFPSASAGLALAQPQSSQQNLLSQLQSQQPLNNVLLGQPQQSLAAALSQAQLASSNTALEAALQKAIAANQEQQQHVAAQLSAILNAVSQSQNQNNFLNSTQAVPNNLLGLDAFSKNAAGQQQAQQQLLLQQMQLQQQQQQLRNMRNKLPHVSGAELKRLQKQIEDLKVQQELQNLQTLRLAQKQEQQAFKYLNQAKRHWPSTYHSLYKGGLSGLTSKSAAGHLLSGRSHVPTSALLHGSSLVNPALVQQLIRGQSQALRPTIMDPTSIWANPGLLKGGEVSNPHLSLGTPDTLSDTGSLRGRSRRVLPYLPAEEPAPLPSERKRRAMAGLRQSSLDGLLGRGYRSHMSYPSNQMMYPKYLGGQYGLSGRPRASSSETNLRKLALADQYQSQRPVSALGLLQASSVVSSRGPTNVTKEHEKRILESILPPDLRHLVRGGSPGTIQQMKQKIEDELRKSTTSDIMPNVSEAELARKKAESKLFGMSSMSGVSGLTSAQSERIRQEMQRYATMRDPRLRAEMKYKTNPVLDAQLNRSRWSSTSRGHRRNLSDPRFTNSLTDSWADEQAYHDPLLPTNRPYSSLGRDYDPLTSTSVGLGGGGGAGGLGMMDHHNLSSRSYLGMASCSYDPNSGNFGLRDSLIDTTAGMDLDRRAYLSGRSRNYLRRSSDGAMIPPDVPSSTYAYNRAHDPFMTTATTSISAGGSPLTGRRAFSSMSGKLLHRSPFTATSSDDESMPGGMTGSDEPDFFKEEKKNRIKMEIAKRRQQIEENASLHEELTRLARLRESSTTTATADHHSVPPVPSAGSSSVLKSVDEILRDVNTSNPMTMLQQTHPPDYYYSDVSGMNQDYDPMSYYGKYSSRNPPPPPPPTSTSSSLFK